MLFGELPLPSTPKEFRPSAWGNRSEVKDHPRFQGRCLVKNPERVPYSLREYLGNWDGTLSGFRPPRARSQGVARAYGRTRCALG